ncbi:MAG: rod shape-determining protein MreC [Candidatus Delongbacteria bacterium]
MTTSARQWISLIAALSISLYFIIFNDSSFNDTLASAGLDAYSLMRYDYFSFREKNELENEIEDLKKRVAILRFHKDRYVSSLEENARLRSLLSIAPPDSFDTVYARSVGKDPGSYPGTILINAGKEKNISQNDPVITENGVAGIVTQTGDKVSKVTLINDPSRKIAVRTEKNRAHGILNPKGPNTAYLNEITKRTDVSAGEKVFTAEHSKLFPGGLLIGSVVFVSDSSATINKIIEVEFSQDPDLIEDVFVLKKISYD